VTYAKGTTVSPEKSRVELDKLLGKHGATARAIGTAPGWAVAHFELQGRKIRVRVPLPTDALFGPGWPEAERAKRKAAWATFGGKEPSPWPRNTRAWVEQAERQRWRAMILLVKAKLEAIEMGLSTVEREFLADLLLPGGVTVHEEIAGTIAAAYQTGNLPPLLGAAGGTR
jgi:hypothetical protein